MHVQILSVSYDSGQPNVRMGRGPEHFLRHGLEQVLHEQGHTVQAESIEVPDPFQAEIKTSFQLYRRLAGRAGEAYRQGIFPLVLSGNCGSALGGVAGIDPNEAGIIWFDAHGDFNTPETTTSGFLDGMGLAAAAGLCWKALTAAIPGFRPVPPSHIVHVGGRDFDEAEWHLLQQAGVTVVRAETIHQSGLAAALEPALAALQIRTRRVYLHLDLDVLDPADTPANELAPPGGLPVSQVEEAIRRIGQRFTVAGAGVASYDPGFDREGKTVQAGLHLITTILAQQAGPYA